MSIAIVMPVRHNPPVRYLAQAFESAWSQAGDALYVEDGSDGAAPALNRAIARAKRDGHTHYFFHAADDVMPKGALDRLADHLIFDPEADMAYGMVQAMDEHGTLGCVWGGGFVPNRMYDTPQIVGAALIKIECWERAGGYPNLLVGADWGMAAKAHRVRPLRVRFLPEVTYWHRQHPATETAQANADRTRYEALYAFLRAVEAGEDV
jgi:hypothetical protein